MDTLICIVMDKAAVHLKLIWLFVQSFGEPLILDE